jgi:hypothetical protein
LDKTKNLRISFYAKSQRQGIVPAAGFFICINHKRADKPIAAKFKAALQKRHPITLNNSRDHYSRSKYTTQVLFSHTHGLFSGCFDEIFDLYNDIQDDFRVIFHSLQKDTFVEYLTGKEYDEYFG